MKWNIFNNVNINLHLIYLLFIFKISVQNESCKLKTTCADCLLSSPNCEWCFENFNNKDVIRCNVKSELLKICKEEFITNEQNIETIKENAEFGHKGNTYEEAVQLKPQRIYLKLRPNVPYTFDVYFKLAEDYPVDLYYLMDLSFTMKDDKKTLSALGGQIANEMNTITKNFRLGFGSFVDKLILPFTLHDNRSLVDECAKIKQECVPPYSFKNHLSLNSNSEDFNRKVNDAKISGNLDGPEGGFDAIMQAMVCESEIGWRNKSRRIIIYSSDATFHFAGDGKLAGIVKPHDGLCHLDKNHVYSYGNKQDYPSISFLNHIIKQKKVVVIFAVSNEYDIYSKLAKKLEGAVAGQLTDESKNVVQLIKETYKNISSRVTLTHRAPAGVTVQIKSDCNEKEGQTCSSVSIGQMIKFSITVKINNKDFQPTNFYIEPVGLNDRLLVELDIISNCSCQKNDIPNSYNCSNGAGTLSCGTCICNPGRLGSRCECEYNTDDDNKQPCQLPNTTLICSNKGKCKCGRCVCDPQENPKNLIYGTYCDCDNFSCLKINDAICADHGECDCKKCKCYHGWTGEFCEESTDKSPCFNESGNGLECSGNGYCNCKPVCRCECNAICQNGKRYSGEFCDKCYTEVERECNEIIKLCTTCNTEEFLENKVSCDPKCKNYKIIDITNKNNLSKGELCKHTVDYCEYTFVLVDQTSLSSNISLSDFDSVQSENKTENKVKVFERYKACYPPPNSLAIGLGVSFGILLLGILLLLLWKLVTFVYDRKEYAKFEKERRNAKFDKGENPIYKRAVTSFKNPAYAN